MPKAESMEQQAYCSFLMLKLLHSRMLNRDCVSVCVDLAPSGGKGVTREGW